MTPDLSQAESQFFFISYIIQKGGNGLLKIGKRPL